MKGIETQNFSNSKIELLKVNNENSSKIGIYKKTNIDDVIKNYYRTEKEVNEINTFLGQYHQDVDARINQHENMLVSIEERRKKFKQNNDSRVPPNFFVVAVRDFAEKIRNSRTAFRNKRIKFKTNCPKTYRYTKKFVRVLSYITLMSYIYNLFFRVLQKKY